MSQFNSIFSPLTNKLARLAGITLLAVAALFASTQQTAAQGAACVTSLQVRLSNSVGCTQTAITPAMLIVGAVPAGAFVKINDLNPTNNGTPSSPNAIVDGISPASGWVYGVYMTSTTPTATEVLICTGTLHTVDFTPPTVTAPQNVEFLCDDVNSVYNVMASWNTPTTQYFAGSLTKTLGSGLGTGADANTTIVDNCGGAIQIKVTDQIAYTECTGAASSAVGTIFATVTRSFSATDQRGNDTTVTQIITFKRPNLDSLVGPIGGANAYAGYSTINGITVDSTNGVFGGGTYLSGAGSNVNMITFNSCTAPSGSAAEVKAELKKYLRSLYRRGYALPLDTKTDIAYIFDNICNYSVDFNYTEFPGCANQKKFLIITSFADMCAMSTAADTVMFSFVDTKKPVFAFERADVGGILGLSAADSVVISVGTNDCTASLRLGTVANMRDLSALFNLKVTDNCSVNNVLSYAVKTRNYWNGPFFVGSSTFVSTNYTVLNASTLPTVIGLPVGEHELTITATDGCGNIQTQVLYFDVVDKVAPVMKCDDELKVSLTSNASSNYYIDGNKSDVDLTQQMQARLYVADINEGSRDNCTLDSLYVRRQFHKDCLKYFQTNMDYDIYGNNSNGTVDLTDFTQVGTSDFYYTPKFMQYVDFFCCDNDQVMVELWGSDAQHYNVGAPTSTPRASANWSFCMGIVSIVDKTEPVITAPNLDKTYNATAKNHVECTNKEVIGTSSNTDGRIANETLSNAMFGFPDIFGLECSGSVAYSVSKALVCDTGRITRTWTVTKGSIVKTASQVIYVRANHNFSITVPVDQAATCSAKSGTDLILDEAGCDLLAVSYSEVKYDAAPGDNFCYYSYRTGTVINWCMVPNHLSCAAADPAAYAVTIPRNTGTTAVKYTFTLSSATAATVRTQTALQASTAGAPVRVIGGVTTVATDIASAAGFVIPTLPACATKAGFAFKYTQIIRVSDIVKPVVASGTAWTPATSAADVADGISWNATKASFSIAGAPSCSAKIKLSFAASDDCATNDLELENAELLNRGTDVAATGTLKAGTLLTGTTNGLFTVEFSGVKPGQHDIRVTVRDDCGNVTVSRLAVDVKDNKAPAPVCVQNLTATLMPDGAGGCMVVVKAIDVFQDINRNWDAEECTPSVVATIAKLTNGVEGAKAATLTLTSADKGGVTARVYLTDGAGNADFCTVTINVEDNFCGNGTASAAIAGAVQTETKATVEGVQVNLSGQTQKSFATGVNGLFIFNNLTAGADYTVTPSLNKGFLNGVSTFDLVLISKHILGVQPLNTPYKLIAADVNNSKSVTTLDLIQLRKLILNIDATFANNSSWRFVDASYTFPNASNPWAASFPEVKNVNDLVGSLSANFVAIKVGDVNGNAFANSTQGSIRNLTSNLGINVADMNLVAGNEYKVDFTAADLNGIEGFQFTLNLDKKGLELVDLVPGIAAEENFGIFAEEGVVTASWNGEAKGGVLFSLVVRAKSNTTLSEVLNLNSRYTAAEAYKGGEVVNVGLIFNASNASANYELYQNTPNPFAGESIIGFNLPAAGTATLTIQDVTGRTLKVINGQYAKGYNQVSLKSTELSATGVLTYTLKAADFTATRKMIIVE